MTDMGLEAPDADAAEQNQDAVPETDADAELAQPEPPLEANVADVVEQEQELGPGDDEYR
jgi:hypothetical protein